MVLVAVWARAACRERKSLSLSPMKHKTAREQLTLPSLFILFGGTAGRAECECCLFVCGEGGSKTQAGEIRP